MEIGQETMAWFTHLLLNWINFTYENEHLSYKILFLPLFLPFFILPFAFLAIIVYLGYVVSLFVYIYKKVNNLPEDILSNSWHKLRHFLAGYVVKIGKILNDYEIIGMEHLPEGPGIIVFYHGTLNTDYVFFICNLYAQKGRLCISVLEKALLLIPGMKLLFDVAPCMAASKADCLEVLKKGYLLGVAPGGSREAIFSDQHYRLVWGKRTGFAQVALEAKVPIVPMFTQNIQEAFRGFGRTGLARWLYEKTRMIGVPIYGGFPVKLRTYLGEPIPYDPNITAEELAEKTKVALENLRNRHQKIPGNISRALSERFVKHPKDD